MAAVASVTLAPGQQVLATLPGAGSLPATVERVAAGGLTVVLAVPAPPGTGRAGQQVVVEHATPRGLRRFITVVRGAPAGGDVLDLALTGEHERIQRREWARVQAVVPVSVSPLGAGVAPGRTHTLDVSAGGLLLQDPWPLPVGADVRLAIALDGGSEGVAAVARVVREAAPGRKAVRLLELVHGDEERLVRYVRERERAQLWVMRGRS